MHLVSVWRFHSWYHSVLGHPQQRYGQLKCVSQWWNFCCMFPQCCPTFRWILTHFPSISLTALTGNDYLIKTEVTKSVDSKPRQAKTTAAMGSGSPQSTYCTGIGSQPEEQKDIIDPDKREKLVQCLNSCEMICINMFVYRLTCIKTLVHTLKLTSY